MRTWFFSMVVLGVAITVLIASAFVSVPGLIVASSEVVALGAAVCASAAGVFSVMREDEDEEEEDSTGRV